MRWEGHVACVRKENNTELKKLLGGHRRRWWNNIKIDLQDMGYENDCRPIKLSPETAQCPSVVSMAL